MWSSDVKHFLLITAACFCLFWSVSGCGYRLEQSGPLSRNVSRVFVPVFDNNTIYPDAGVAFSNALIQEIMEQTTTKVSKAQDASCQIRGSVKKIVFSPVFRDADETVWQQKITVWADIELVHENEKILWNARKMTASKDYTVSRGQSPTTNRIQEKETHIQNAIQSIAQRIAQKAVHAMRNDF